jgi:hypothetical protein
MAFAPNQVVTTDKDIFAWSSPDTTQPPYGKYLKGTQVTVIAQTGNVVQVRSVVAPSRSK